MEFFSFPVPAAPLSIPISAMCMAGCETHGALAHSLVPAALGSAKLGLCMVLISTKYVAAAQKGFVVQAQPFAHSWGLPGSGFAWCFAFSDWWIQMLHFACSSCCMQRQFRGLWNWMWTFVGVQQVKIQRRKFSASVSQLWLHLIITFCFHTCRNVGLVTYIRLWL